VIGAIESLGRDMTILIVAHRPSAIAVCDRVIKLDQGRIVSETRRAEVFPGRLRHRWRR
jgi:ATP-binding cassette subfamily B protein